MVDTEQLDLIWIILFSFAPTFIFASMLRAKGVTGLLAITGIIAIAASLIHGLHDWRLNIAGIAALVGLVIGGKISDARELARARRADQLAKKQRESRNVRRA